ncbi:MAG TPA: 2-C-methyl-D-erythritol 2,4-cyclodiphosphate synthase [Candidatus Polarisedimenticolia bacterium]|nr:2-C-methyl-D-erythritol 2,4-cyclodiphosphate synthase [Candidatus Polarisedimenticolia bacterium]
MTRRRPRASGRAGTRVSSARRASAKPPRPLDGLVPRLGFGIDRHPFAPGRRLVLGGVVIPGADGLQGHSDADVLTHAICDAILGALGLPDLGIRFPASKPRWRGRKSLFFLRDIVKEMRSRRYAIGNLDVVVLAEEPALRRHLETMRAILARVIGCDLAQVSIKPKRGEGLGFVGRGEGIEVHAAVLLLASR